jgi:hypothetical protein
MQSVARLHGYQIERRGNDLIYHWLRHVLVHEQWASQTTATDDLRDAQQAVRSQGIRLLVYRSARGDHVATVIAETANAVAAHRLGTSAGPLFLIVYSADTAAIVTAYMVRSQAAITLPEDATWLIR